MRAERAGRHEVARRRRSFLHNHCERADKERKGTTVRGSARRRARMEQGVIADSGDMVQDDVGTMLTRAPAGATDAQTELRAPVMSRADRGPLRPAQLRSVRQRNAK